ncbi:MAG: hypothetical protein J7623_19605 [Chitinophaga sp.]|uniref:hypothetical protein n=1 Tax=Chitinophaga sp. TaxID=1869181 RepID=UPI001AFE4F9B|nr:hypothetical protein [Chitinophaga sp.]MBO9730855.1 hypothetical protein [Chitinophaga sp.]
MNISFDLDDTLIPGVKRFPVERRTIWQKLVSRESLRSGTVALMKRLIQDNHRVHIYTTSYRSPFYIRMLFLSYGIYVNKIINKSVHDKTLEKRAGSISKYPPAFGIDWHIDDSPGVAIEGTRHQFRTIIIPENDMEWTTTILTQLLAGEAGA